MRKLIIFLICLLFATSVSAQTYYVDATGGNDAWSGTFAYPQAGGGPWRTLKKVSDYALQPGDKVLLKRGEVWRTQKSDTTPATNRLYIHQSGTQTKPIIFDAYGNGRAPIVSGGRLIPRGISAGWSGPNASGVYTLDLGFSDEFYTSVPALVRGTPTGASGYVLLQRLDAVPLVPNSYKTRLVNGHRYLEYMPPTSEEVPTNYEFEISVNGSPILITGSDVRLNNIDGMLANRQHSRDILTPPAPFGSGVFRAEGARVWFSNCKASFSASSGIVIRGPDNVINRCVAAHNHSTGLYIENRKIVGVPAPDRSIIQNSRSEYNGNLESDKLDKGGIGVQGDFAIIRRNLVRSNGYLKSKIDEEDAAISLHQCHDVTVDQNFIANSARNAIAVSYVDPDPRTGIVNAEDISYGHKILRNIIHNWNLDGIVLLDGRNSSPTYQNTSAIYLPSYGNTENSGRFTVHNNTIFSDQSTAYLFGIHFSLPATSDYLNYTSVKNNIVYLKGNIYPQTRALRINKAKLFATEINYNNFYIENSTRVYEFAGVDYADQLDFFTRGGLVYESNSINAPPKFIAAVPVADTNFDLSIDSPNTDAGVFVGLTKDYLNRLIPSGLLPDIGAFEQGSQPVGPGLLVGSN